MQYNGTVKGASGAMAEVEWQDKPPKLYSVLTFPEQPKAKLVVVSSASPTSVYCMVLHSPGKITRGQQVIDTHQPVSIHVGEAVLGRAMDIFGNPHDGGKPIKAEHMQPLFSPIEIENSQLVHATELQETGIKPIDFFTPMIRGGKAALVGGAGIGKTIILTELINRLVVESKLAKGQVAVFSAVGERSREALELFESLRQGQVLPHTSLIIGQMGENPAVRWHTAYGSTAVVEHFRDVMGKDVIFFMDNIFRFSQAGQELATLMHTIPSEDGYQATLTSQIASLNQRLVSTKQGYVTSIMALFVPSDDVTDAAVRAVLPFLDTIIILSRDVFQQGRYPAMDLLNSSSSAIEPDIVGKKHYDTHTKARQVLEQAASLERIVSLVGIKELSATDQSTYVRAQLIQNYMTQDLLYAQFNPDEGRQYIPREEIIDSVIDILDGKYDNVPPEKLIFCGSLKTVEQQPAHQ
jgi:F-type H+/Na+-transporting ATPase subunit beta